MPESSWYLFPGIIPLQRSLQDKGKKLTNQLQLKTCLYTAAPVHHADCHRKINSLCTFGNYSSHLGVIYLLYNMSQAICFGVAKVQLKLLQVSGFQKWHNVWLSASLLWNMDYWVGRKPFPPGLSVYIAQKFPCTLFRKRIVLSFSWCFSRCPKWSH